MFSRRRFLTASAAWLSATRLVSAEGADGMAELRARQLDGQILDMGEPKTRVWSFGPQWPQPILRAKQGEEFALRIVNELDRELSLHWHGIRGPAGMMTVNIAPGEANGVECRFTPPDAGTFWLGPVKDVSRQREMGLYAMIIVAEKQPPAGIVERPLILDDWKLTDDGVIEDDFGDLEEAIGQGRLGNWFTVNGSYRPRIDAPRGQLLRLRVLNTANVRTMGLQFKGSTPWVVALDGQPVAPLQVGASSLMLAPGQRCDLLIEEDEDDVTIALDLFEDMAEIAYLIRSGDPSKAKLPENFMLPANPVAEIGDPSRARRVPLVIEGGAKGGLKSAFYQGEKLELRALLDKGMAWALNGSAGIAAQPWQVFRKDEEIVLAIDNRTAFAQPLHIQGHVWREIWPGGKPVVDQPWRDTAVVAPRSRAEFALRMDNPGDWALHSTVAERIDSGLITSFQVA